MKDGASTSSARTEIGISKSVLSAILQAAHAAHPKEACGILLGSGSRVESVIETANTHPTPLTHFEIDPQALINSHRAERDGGAQVIGYFHSHPVGAASPSATDQKMAAGDGKVWAIIAGEELAFWRDEPGGFTALSYAIEAG